MTDTKQPKEHPLVSVIIPVHNGERYLAAALESVFAQDYPHTEVIVVDDGSTDGTGDAMRPYAPINVLRQNNQGPSAARNRGLAGAHGEFVAFLDADDRWLPGKLSAQARYLREHPDHGYVLCRMRAVTEEGLALPKGLNARHYAADPIAQIPSALFIRAAAMALVGPFDPTLRTAEDFDWFARARDLSVTAGVIDEVLLEKRLHGANLSLDVASNQAAMFMALKRSIDRKQRHPGEFGRSGEGETVG